VRALRDSGPATPKKPNPGAIADAVLVQSRKSVYAVIGRDYAGAIAWLAPETSRGWLNNQSQDRNKDVSILALDAVLKQFGV